MSHTQTEILQVLSQVRHPDKKQNIVDEQMIENLKVDGKEVSFSLAFEKSNDPFIKSIRKACTQAIYDFDPTIILKEIEIKAKKVFVPKAENQILPGVKNIIAVASGKGGVGKSTVAANLAVALSQFGYEVGLVDADIYGPSIPTMFGVEDAKPFAIEKDGKTKIEPVNRFNISMLSIGFFVEPEKALIWRGPMASNALTSLFKDGEWGELDFMIVDLPPGTGDIHLTLVQTLPITGAVIVSTPQDVALADARKGVAMFGQKDVNVPVLGLIENMSYFTPEELPDNKYYLFGKDGVKKLAAEMKVPVLGEIPIVQSIREGGDNGFPVTLDEDHPAGNEFRNTAAQVLKALDLRIQNLEPTKIVEVDPNTKGCATD